jgi:[ribosomal protein S5]-alanine N-acetyltransferase
MKAIRPLAERDARALLRLRLKNRAFLAPFDPVRPESFFTLETQTAIARNPHGLRFAILDGRALAGTTALSNVSLGPFLSANVGYWVSADRNGRGLASRAVGELSEHAFGELGLHRLEAGTLVGQRRLTARAREERLRADRPCTQLPAHQRRLARPPALPADGRGHRPEPGVTRRPRQAMAET